VTVADASTRDLVDVLRRHATSARALDRLKTLYRPYICPFDDLLKLVPPGAAVFDIGCGNGAFLLLVAVLRRPSALGGVEVSPRLIANAQSLLAGPSAGIGLDLRVYDGVTIPDLGNYECVFLIDVLHHVPLPVRDAFLAHIWEAMAPGATLVLKDIDAASRLLCGCNKLHDLLLSGEVGHEIEAAAAIRALDHLGFRIDAVSRRRVLWYPHYTVVATKPPTATSVPTSAGKGSSR
jgi:2-polyprenyl-3-methyl-5-hydroxy-6-metoxy-1,4-benzoquinol methylase